jgi:hypothetical protein
MARTRSGGPPNGDANSGDAKSMTIGPFIGIGVGCAVLVGIIVTCIVMKKRRRNEIFMSRSSLSGGDEFSAVQVSIDGPEAGEPFIDNYADRTNIDEDTHRFRGEHVFRLGLL